MPKIQIERSAIIPVGRDASGAAMDVTKTGEVLLVVQHEGVRAQILFTPEEAEGWAVGMIQRAMVARTVAAQPIQTPPPNLTR